MRYLSALLILFTVLFTSWANDPGYKSEIIDPAVKNHRFNNIVLEMSLKPFKKNDKEYIREVAREVFTQWYALLRHADTVSVMLWTGEGSEILEYKGSMEQPLEWARYIGNPNTEHEVGSGPPELSIHERAFLYMDDPPSFTYGDLKFIIGALREAGREVTGKPMRIGATFDPGPEFAISEFKYKKHPEIMGGHVMGRNTFVNVYSHLNASDEPYAGFPDGIPDKTPFGVYFGRQSQHFLTDLGFDYIWFSNGLGFGVEVWSSTGAVFDGKGFDHEKLVEGVANINDFWVYFREECPEFPIQTRGTNLSAGADLARDAVDLRAVYTGGFNMLPPVNSPWAALDGDFGLEMAGYMSRMAEIPDYRFPFRFYTHDPWWQNSPWLDRYGREPHDIYLPMAVCRIDSEGNIGIPTQLNFLTIDDSFGNMPVQVPNEVTPHILKARYDSPTAPGPLVWVYPFDEYHDWAHDYPDRLPEIYYGDWFIRQAINNGLPLNTVISTTSYQSAIKLKPGMFNESILITIAPDEGSPLERALMDFVEDGGHLVIYGPVDYSGEAFREFINLENDKPLEGEFNMVSDYSIDVMRTGHPRVINHRSVVSGGGVSTTLKNANDPSTRLLVQLEQSGQKRDVAWLIEKSGWKGGKIVYLRGTNSSSFTGGRLLTPDNPTQWFIGPLQLRYVLQEFGVNFSFAKDDPSPRNPVLTVARSNNAFIFSGYNPSNNIRHRFRMPQGAPMLLGLESEFEDGHSTWFLPTAWNRECRVFVEQEDGLVSYRERTTEQRGITRRLQVSGLKNATVRIYAEDHVTSESFNAYVNARYPWREGRVAFREGRKYPGKYFVVENVTGTLVVSW
ncbi:MAG: hypothetical protein ACFCUM_17610 [Bacteroidales bacterium]